MLTKLTAKNHDVKVTLDFSSNDLMCVDEVLRDAVLPALIALGFQKESVAAAMYDIAEEITTTE